MRHYDPNTSLSRGLFALLGTYKHPTCGVTSHNMIGSNFLNTNISLKPVVYMMNLLILSRSSANEYMSMVISNSLVNREPTNIIGDRKLRKKISSALRERSYDRKRNKQGNDVGETALVRVPK